VKEGEGADGVFKLEATARATQWGMLADAGELAMTVVAWVRPSGSVEPPTGGPGALFNYPKDFQTASNGRIQNSK
jgi:hypothetical protein